MEPKPLTMRVISTLESIVKRTIDSKWSFTKSGAAAMYVERGIEQLPALFGVAGGTESMNPSRITDYLVYQIYLKRDAIAEGIWHYTWLFSSHALENYRRQFLDENGKAGMNYYIDKWLKKHGLDRVSITGKIALPSEPMSKKLVYMASEEPVKRRFFNTEEGFALCQIATTGWSPLSQACKECNKWIECGKLTAAKYPEIMRYRKEEYGRQKKQR